MIKDTEARVELNNSCFKTGDIITMTGVKRKFKWYDFINPYIWFKGRPLKQYKVTHNYKSSIDITPIYYTY